MKMRTPNKKHYENSFSIINASQVMQYFCFNARPNQRKQVMLLKGGGGGGGKVLEVKKQKTLPGWCPCHSTDRLKGALHRLLIQEL